MRIYSEEEVTPDSPGSSQKNVYSDQDVTPDQGQQEESSLFTESSFPEERTLGTQSPLSWVERAALSRADDSNRADYLSKKFNYVEKLPNGKYAVGDDPRILSPIDPEGMFNDVVGDVADVAGDLAVVLGQIAGTAVGAVGGAAMAGPAGIAPGMMAGAGVGAGVAEAGVSQIAKSSGMNSGEHQATDVAIATLFAAAGEGVGQAIGAFGPRAMERVGKVLGQAQKRVALQGAEASSRFENGAAKILHVTSSYPEKGTHIVFRDGAEKVFSHENLNPNTILKLAEDVKTGIKSQQETLGNLVASGVDEIVSKTSGGKVVDITDPFRALTDQLKGIGILQEGNIINPNWASSADRSVFKNLMSQVTRPYSMKEPKFGLHGENMGRKTFQGFIEPTEKFQVGKMFSIVRQFSDDKLQQGMSDEGKGFLRQFLRTQMDEKIPSIMGEVGKIAEQVGAKKFLAANANFKAFMNFSTGLQKIGLDINNPSSISNFTKGYLRNADPITEQAMRMLDNQVAGTLGKRLEQFSAAQGTLLTNFNLLRFGAVGSIIGFGTDLPPGVKIGASVLLGTPFGARQILKAGGVLKKSGASSGAGVKAAKEALKNLIPKVPKGTGEAVMSQLLRSKTRGQR